jgi:hypothetical protein
MELTSRRRRVCQDWVPAHVVVKADVDGAASASALLLRALVDRQVSAKAQLRAAKARAAAAAARRQSLLTAARARAEAARKTETDDYTLVQFLRQLYGRRIGNSHWAAL